MGKTAKNDITRATIKTKPNTDKFRTGWDRIFGEKPKRVPAVGEGDLENLTEIREWEEQNEHST